MIAESAKSMRVALEDALLRATDDETDIAIDMRRSTDASLDGAYVTLMAELHFILVSP